MLSMPLPLVTGKLVFTRGLFCLFLIWQNSSVWIGLSAVQIFERIGLARDALGFVLPKMLVAVP